MIILNFNCYNIDHCSYIAEVFEYFLIKQKRYYGNEGWIIPKHQPHSINTCFVGGYDHHAVGLTLCAALASERIP